MIAFCHACNMTALLGQRVSGGAMIAFCHACNMTALLGQRVSGGAMIAFCHACNMTALSGQRVSGWGDDSILSRMQHDCIVGSKGFTVGR